MEVRKLYYEDCMLQSFTARVTECAPAENGYNVVLDATAFYPEGGGQACDLGILGDARVLAVSEQGERVIHLCDKPLAVGTEVTGTIDWERRFDQMQQHAGEHILSGLLHEKFGCHNVGFHVGKGVMEIDFDTPVPPEDLALLEAKANEIVWQDLPLRCYYPAPEELAKLSYRSKKALAWPVRIVEVPGVDVCACCGVHVARTGQIGMIKVLSCVKFHQGVRIELVCGKRAFEYLSRIYEQNRQVSQLFSAKVPETAAAAKRVQEQLNAEKARAAALEKQLFAAVAEGYAGKGNVCHIAPELTPVATRELADRIAAVCGGVAAVIGGTDGNYNVCLICKDGDVNDLGKAMTAALNGRGGGRNGSFQGSLRANCEQIAEFFRGRAFSL